VRPKRIYVFGLLSVLGAVGVSEARALNDTNGSVSALSRRITDADGIIVTNWATGEPGFGVFITGSNVTRIVKAVSKAKRYANQEHPDWEWDWQLRFHQGSNFLAAICFARDTFLADGVYRDATGALAQVYRDSVNQEYVARVYKEEDKEFAETTKAEAREWLRSPLHSILGEDKKKVLKYVNEFYATGASNVFIADIKKQANENTLLENAEYLCVVLPSDTKARRKVFRVHRRAVLEWGFDADDDVGQKYTWYPIDWHDVK
jgi:hypothetical protein